MTDFCQYKIPYGEKKMKEKNLKMKNKKWNISVVET